jgi:hypothetical protein
MGVITLSLHSTYQRQCNTEVWIDGGNGIYLPNTSFNITFAIFSAKSLLPFSVQ